MVAKNVSALVPQNESGCGRQLTWMFILELGQVIDILIDDDPEAVSCVMRRNVALRESPRHDVCDEKGARRKKDPTTRPTENGGAGRGKIQVSRPRRTIYIRPQGGRRGKREEESETTPHSAEKYWPAARRTLDLSHACAAALAAAARAPPVRRRIVPHGGRRAPATTGHETQTRRLGAHSISGHPPARAALRCRPLGSVIGRRRPNRESAEAPLRTPRDIGRRRLTQRPTPAHRGGERR